MRVSALALVCLLAAAPAAAQQKIAHVDSEQILDRLPDFKTVLGEVERLTGQYQAEIDELEREAEQMARDFTARELLYTEAEREAAQAEIGAKQQEASALRRRYFGPEGELFREQQQRLRPVQERLLEAIENAADEAGYDYVLDRSGEVVFLYAKPQHDLTERVLEELGVRTQTTGGIGR